METRVTEVADGIHQLATVTGDASSGYVVNLTIGV